MKSILIVVAATLALTVSGREASAQQFSSEQLARRTVERRAVEAVIWGTPAVNFEVMHQAMVRDAKAGVGGNKVVYWSRLFDWKNQTLTPNPDAIYFMPFFDTRDVGPIVLEMPAASADGSITGSVDDAWQTAVADVGPAGVDKGKGGKYLILSPGYKQSVPAGYIVLRPQTYQGFALLRSILKSGSEADVAKAVAYGKRIKFYPLSAAGKSPATQFVDAIDVVFEANIPYDLRFFESLDRVVQHEPWLDRDRVMIDKLRSIGIEKGKPFRPDAPTQEILRAAVAEAHAWLKNSYETGQFSSPPFYTGGRWSVPASPAVVQGMSTAFGDPNAYPVDGRGTAYTIGFFSAKQLGAGQFYLMTFKDRVGEPLDGSRGYRLTVPANVPVRQYWSATVYDRETHALVRNVPRASRSSDSPGLQKNTDGSTDLYFGPQAPAGKESNWVPTRAGAGFEVLFRFYGPDKSFFEKKWQLPDIERMN